MTLTTRRSETAHWFLPLLLGQIFFQPILVSDQAQAQQFRVQDEIAFRKIEDGDGRPVIWSPDKKHFALIVSHGDLGRNSIVSEMYLYSISDIIRKGKNFRPRKLDTADSQLNLSAIQRVRWEDNKNLLYLRTEQRSGPRLTRVSVGGERKSLSPKSLSVTAYDVDNFAARGIIAVVAPPRDLGSLSEGIVAGPRMFIDVFNDALRFPMFTERYFYSLSLRSGQAVKLAGIPPHISFATFMQSGMAISPSGRWAVLPVHSDAQSALANSNALFFPRYVLVDLASNADTVAQRNLSIGGSFGLGFASLSLAWSPDESRVFVAESFQDRSAQTPTSIVGFDTATGRKFELGSMPFGTQISGIEAVTSDAVEVISGNSTTLYSFSDGAWSSKAAVLSTAEPGFISADIEQDLNTPPHLVVRSGSNPPIEFNFNPGLSRFDFSNASLFRWRSGSKEWTGILVKPPHYDPSHKYPLVIQTHGYKLTGKQFFLNGPTVDVTSGYAARALAARGMIVLQVPDAIENSGTSKEISDNAEVIASAVHTLSEQGIVDPTRIGIHGSSRSGYYIQDMMFGCDFPVVAVSVAEGNHISREEYAASFGGHSRGDMAAVERVAGLPPLFGIGSAEAWARRDPEGHLAGVTSAVLIQAYAAGMGEWWHTYTLLRRNARAAEYVYYPDAAHTPLKPRERLSAQGSIVDWYDFWLNGREDSEAVKAPQYERWRQLRTWRAAALRAGIDKTYCRLRSSF
jgi:dipeptidyl aminopeptidase/acylaminoacyl peptidase